MKVLATKFVGYAPDPDRLHDPRSQLVYEVKGEYEVLPRRKRSLFIEDNDAEFDAKFDRCLRVALAILLALFLVNSWFL